MFCDWRDIQIDENGRLRLIFTGISLSHFIIRDSELMRRDLSVQIEPLKQENEKLIRENNQLHQQMI